MTLTLDLSPADYFEDNPFADMSPIQQKPILHGRDHCPGGADPIPCLTSALSGSFEERVLASLRSIGYWPLDEASGDALDASGNGASTCDPVATPLGRRAGRLRHRRRPRSGDGHRCLRLAGRRLLPGATTRI